MQDSLIRIFVGFDSRFPVAYHVLAQSILERSSVPVALTPINLSNLASIFDRERNALQSTEFSFSRFLTPYLCGFEGWSVFMDNDMIVLEDFARLWELRDDRFAAMCVQHDYTPKSDKKFLGATQTKYEKKNWSSLIIFNNAKCTALTPDYVQNASGLELHQFKWLGDDALIGALPQRWNVLVGYHDDVEDPACIHFTDGAPFYPDYADTGFAAEWFAAYRRANSSAEADADWLTAASHRAAGAGGGAGDT